MLDREQLRRELLRRLTDRHPSMPGFLVDELLTDTLEVIDAALTETRTTTHPPAELIVDLKMYARQAPDGLRVTCDGRELAARPMWW